MSDFLCTFKLKIEKILKRSILPVLVAFIAFAFPVSSYAADVKTFDFSVDVHSPVIAQSESYGTGSVVLSSTNELNPTLVFDVILPYDVLDSVISDYFVFNLIAHESSQDLTGVSFSTYVEFFSNTNTLVGTYSGSWSNWESRSVSARFTTQNRISRHINRVRFVCHWNGGQAVRYENLLLNIYAVVTNSDGTQSIIQAINDQTAIIGGKLDDTNDYIDNGNDDTSGIVSQFQDNLDEFNSVINQFDDIENGFITDFTSSNDEIKSILSDYQFTGNLLSCANWVTDRYMDFFDNSGDFKQYFIYPLIMGIVLFFIGRGQVILGNLYRKPYDSTTHTVTTGYTVRFTDGSKRTESISRTTGKGGKLRK